MTVPQVAKELKRLPLYGFTVWNLRAIRRCELLERAMSLLMRSKGTWPSEEELVELEEINRELAGKDGGRHLKRAA